MTSTANMAFTPLPPTQNQLSCQAQPKQDTEALQKRPFTKGSSLVSERGHLRVAWFILSSQINCSQVKNCINYLQSQPQTRESISNLTTRQSLRHPQTLHQKDCLLNGPKGQVLLLAEGWSVWLPRAKCWGSGKWVECVFPRQSSTQNRQLQELLHRVTPVGTEGSCLPHLWDTSTNSHGCTIVKHQFHLYQGLWQGYQAYSSFSWPSQEAEPKHPMIFFPLSISENH